MSSRVIIIGGGFAGLAAGVALSRRGHRVLLLEGRNHLGGRAYSFIDSKTGDVIDNGQHLFMGCYHNTIAFLEIIGRRDRLMIQESPSVDFLSADTGPTRFQCPPLPSPLHAVAGLFRLGGLTLGDKLRTLRMAGAFKKNGSGAAGLTVAKWLASLGQSERISRRFWNPIAIATLNENPTIASAAMLRVVLTEAFGGDRFASSIGIARVGLSDLYTDGARAFIEMHGGEVRTGTPVSRVVIDGVVARGVNTRSGDFLEADHVISAIPPAALSLIIPDGLHEAEFAALDSLGTSPIVSINLWFDRSITDREFIGLIGTRIQWLFNKDRLLSQSRHSNQVALVISAAREFVDKTRDELVQIALSDLRSLLPASREASVVHSVVVKEREATLSHTVESDSLRLSARTSIPNFILAGDWTRTGLPATIEGAVLSGKTAAQLIDPGAELG